MLSILFAHNAGGTFFLKRDEKFLCGHGSLGRMGEASRMVRGLFYDNRIR
jgi:hypothetical protein